MRKPLPRKVLKEGHSADYVRVRRPADLAITINLSLRCRWLKDHDFVVVSVE